MKNWITQYDVTDPTDLGTAATPDDAGSYNRVQRAHLADQYPLGPPTIDDSDDTDPVEAYIEEHYMTWLREATPPPSSECSEP